MGGYFEKWFRFESKAQREKRQAAYERRLFPLGKEQREWEEAMLKQLYPQKKDVFDLHYSLLTLREGLVNSRLDPDHDDYVDEETALRRWQVSRTTKFLKGAELYVVQAMAFLEHRAADMESLPDREEILARAQDLQEGEGTDGE